LHFLPSAGSYSELAVQAVHLASEAASLSPNLSLEQTHLLMLFQVNNSPASADLHFSSQAD